jgi:hypothetical protein
MALLKGLSLLLLLVGPISGTDVDNEAFYGPNTDGLGDVAQSLRQRKRKLSKNNKSGGKNEAPAPVQVPASASQTVPVMAPQSVAVTTTSTSNGDSSITDRSSTTQDTAVMTGIPVMTGSCPGTDQVLIDYGNFQLTQSACGYLEKRACVNPYTVSEYKKADFRTSPSCLDGTCTGCCRDFGFLECDTTGRSMNALVPCVCSERTYGGVRFGPPSGPSGIVVTPPVPTTPVAAPATAPTPVPDRTGPGTPSAIIVTPPGQAQCRSNFLGQGLGQKPDITPVDLPFGYAPGECTTSSHCAGTTGTCCMRGFCLCGSPIQGRMNCLA